MQPFIAAMTKARQTFYAAIVKSLLRTKSLLQTFLNIWISPSSINGASIDSGSGQTRAFEFIDQVEAAFNVSTSRLKLAALSDELRNQFVETLSNSKQCMLPSYNHQLPTGDEIGKYLALDVGGSTFRVALIELSGRESRGEDSKILKINSYKIDNTVKQLKGVPFFDWMAERIGEALSGQTTGLELSKQPLSMGLAWSFPIEQTSLRSGLLQGMGKGFLAAYGLLGQDLGDLIQGACLRKDLNVQLNAIVNDSSATLLSMAYLDPTTRFGLILGTGVNAAVHLPVPILSPTKFGVRPAAWHDSAKHVIVNTELSMFGAGILPFTKWDEALRAGHPLPDFQPLEHFVSGRYLGEIVRLVLVDGIQNGGLFRGVIPASLKESYSLDTETLSYIESDRSPDLSSARQLFNSRHPSAEQPSEADLNAVRLIASQVTQRACGIVAASVHALWQLRNEAESIPANDYSHTLVAYNGSVLESYPGFRDTCQHRLDILVETSGGRRGAVELRHAQESSLLGAAVAVACLDGRK